MFSLSFKLSVFRKFVSFIVNGLIKSVDDENQVRNSNIKSAGNILEVLNKLRFKM